MMEPPGFLKLGKDRKVQHACGDAVPERVDFWWEEWKKKGHWTCADRICIKCKNPAGGLDCDVKFQTWIVKEASKDN